MEVIRQGWLPILLGALVGSLVSIISVFLLCQAFQIDTTLMLSLLPKSVTTPIAICLLYTSIGERHMEIIFGFAGGLALFIFGMNEMGSGLQKVAVNKMRNILGALTSIPIIGVLVGTLVTGIIQSSSATTVMVVGFVNAGLLTLKQAISVLMGANIGTTVTAQLVSFNLMEYYLPMIAVGFFLYFVCKKKGLKSGGQILFSFGILFMGCLLYTSPWEEIFVVALAT